MSFIVFVTKWLSSKSTKVIEMQKETKKNNRKSIEINNLNYFLANEFPNEVDDIQPSVDYTWRVANGSYDFLLTVKMISV